jgi:heptosyltransferase-2
MRNKIDKILIVRFSSLGDIILTTPVIGALWAQFPGSKISFLTKTRYADLLRNDPRISTIIEFDPPGRHKGFSGFRRMIADLRSCDFDLLVDLHANLRSFFVRHLVKSKVKLKYRKRWWFRFSMVHFKFLKTKAVHTTDSYLDVLRKIQVEMTKEGPSIYLGPEDVEFSNHFLLERNVKKDDIVVGVHPGAKWETKRWDKGNFKETCRALMDKHNCRILLFGNAGEEKLVDDIKRDLPEERMILAVGLSLGRFMSLIKRCDCLVTNDSGPMHLASALGVPVVAIFGPTHPKLGFAPTGLSDVVLCADVKCSPCSLHGEKRCSKKSRFCMDLIQPEMVVEAVERILEKNRSFPKEN